MSVVIKNTIHSPGFLQFKNNVKLSYLLSRINPSWPPILHLVNLLPLLLFPIFQGFHLFIQISLLPFSAISLSVKILQIHGSLHLLTNILSIVHVKVRLPNNQHVFATDIGTVNIQSGLVLIDVLYIPQFSVNLISASKLTSAISCCLSFLNDHCYIQDLLQWRMIEVAKIFEGLYHLLQTTDALLDSSPTAFFVSCNQSSYKPSFLWHCQLGHLSDFRLQLIKHVLLSHSSHILQTPSHCSIGHLSKHKKLPFQDSTSQSAYIFSSYTMISKDLF